ncbi:MAG: translation elongation factor Ts [Bacillales bacterium]|nr:translation elongation factor Ts [Bacillales bacterium]
MASENLIALIKVLRERTGAGMMDCKKALEASGNDVEKSIDWLREKGIAKQAAKASRIAAEGMASTYVEGNKAIILEVKCETDFVAKGDRYHALVENVAKQTLEANAKDIDSAKEITNQLFVDATVAMGEKINYRRFEFVEKQDGEEFGAYVHMGGKIAVVTVTSKNADVAKGLAIHIAANNPQYISMKDIPADVLEHERAITLEAAKNDEKLANKPENILKGIVEGKVRKMLAESVLEEQVYLMGDGTQTVGQYLKSVGVTLVKFVRYALGDGLEKRVDNFAEEVMKEAK